MFRWFSLLVLPAQLLAQPTDPANWEGFAGFVADIDVEFAGRLAAGRIVVEPGGQVFVEHLPGPHAAWAQRKLACLVRQQLPQRGLTSKRWQFAVMKSTESQARSWKRVGSYQLPAAIQVLKTEGDSETAREAIGWIKLSNHRLFTP